MERVQHNWRWLLEGWEGGPARRMTEGQVEARWEALAAGFGWAVQLAVRRAEGLAEAMRVEEEGQEDGELGEGMAAVDEIWERRRVRGGYEARVAWVGTDPETGEAWPHSWVSEAWLSADLQRKRVRLPARRVSVEERSVRGVEEQQLAARKKRVEEARRLREMAERDRRASDRGARTHGARGVGLGFERAWWWGRQEEGWQRLRRGAPLGKA